MIRRQKFGEGYGPVLRAMAALANSYSPSEIAECGYKLYEEFRPDVPAGARGWGAAGVLDVGQILGLKDKATGLTAA
jgi:hypothetical protein